MSEVGYDLKAPCNDCPFRRSSPLHKGVLHSLPDYEKRITEGEFGHSCHKTDERADSGFVSLVNGKIQHCVGALAFMKKMEEADDPEEPKLKTQMGLLRALVRGVEYDKIPTDDIYDDFDDIVKAYKPLIDELVEKDKKEKENRLTISIRRKGGQRETYTY